MKQINVPYLQDTRYSDPIQMTSAQLDQLQRHLLDCVPWPLYPYKPEVAFTIAHSNTCIFLKFYITEKIIRAATAEINGNVWKDACVEFFIAFDDTRYYNLEFNCIGTISAAFGAERAGRQPIHQELIRKINYGITIHNQADGNIHWEMTASIPLTVFTHTKQDALNRKQCKANFYKCGDELEEPHFVAWSRIDTPEPDFHLPSFFGLLTFE